MHEKEQEFSFKSLFIPFTNVKAIHYIVIIGFLVFGNMLFNDFVWDDRGYIIENPLVHTINIPALFEKNFYNTASQYRPLPALFFATLYSFFSTTPFFYHVIQLILHCINTILVFIVFRQFFKKGIVFFLSIVFLVHPIQVESVSYIASSVNPLFFFFGITAFLLSMKENVSGIRLMIISSLLFLALLSKETGGLFIFLILLNRIFYKNKEMIAFCVGLSISSVSYYFLRVFAIGNQYEQLHLSPIAGLNLIERIGNIPLIIFYYLTNFFYPSHLAIEQLWVIKRIDFSNFYFPLLIDSLFFLAIFALGGYIYKYHKKVIPSFLFFFAWFLIGLGMHLQLVPLDFTVSDRWFYFPLVGLLGLVGVLINFLKFSNKIIKIVGITLGVVIVTFFSLLTTIRNTDWRDAITLFTHDSRLVKNYDIENNLGNEYFRQKNYSQALIHYQEAEKLFSYELSLYNLGVVYQKLGNPKKAEEYYLKVINKDSYILDKRFHLAAYVGLAEVITYSQTPTNESVVIIKEGLEQYPDSGNLWAALAYSYFRLNNNSEMLVALKKAEKLLPADQTKMVYDLIYGIGDKK